jgi:phosphatidylglycerol:prolipoprotein diacylglycerol transferase
MHPTLFEIGGVPIQSYAVFVGLGFLVAFLVRRAEVKRLGYAKEPGHRWVGLGALLGAVLGTKLGMVLFEEPDHLHHLFVQMLSMDFSGKTIVGALIVSFVSVEITKRVVGIEKPTGDAFALSFLLGTAVGRIGCFLNGCCYGKVTQSAIGVTMVGAKRHPVQLYESALMLLLAGVVFAIRKQPRERGRLWRMVLLGYAIVRFNLEFFRGDPVRHVGPLTAVQLACLMCAGLLVLDLARPARVAAT